MISDGLERSPSKIFPYITKPTALFKYFKKFKVPGLVNKTSLFTLFGANKFLEIN